MLKREFGVFLLVGCLILISAPTASCRSPAPTVYVSGDGTGDFNCDGKDDHVQINQALKFVASNSKYTTVHLKGPFTYVIDDTLLIGSNTILEGDSNAVIKLANNAGWVTMKPMIQQMSKSGNNNIVIRGFEVNGNHDGNPKISKGKGYYNVIYFTNCNNIKVYNMYMHDGLGDGLRIKSGKNIQFYNNKIYKLGHDGLFAIQCENVEAWNNKITCRTNSGLRIWNSNHVKFHDNVIDSFYHWSAGGPGIQVEKSAGIMDDIEIYNNAISNTYGPGIWIFNYDTSSTKDKGKNVHIHHNVFYGTGTNPSITWVGGIVASGFHDTLIENNVFDGVYHAAVIHMYPEVYSPRHSSKYTTIIRNNIIVNTQKRTKSPSGTGYGVISYLTKNHNFLLENNCLYNNAAGNYKGCTSKTDIYLNPLFVNQKNHDYHLQSVAGHWNGKKWVKDKVNSPCIDAGYLSSDYSKEPEDNGNRINIGRYGNTIYASLSSPSRVKTVQSSLMYSITGATNDTCENINFTEEVFDANEDNFTHSENLSVDFEQDLVIEPIPEATVKIGENLNFTVKASDVNGGNLTFSASELPEGANFDEIGVFNWTPSDGQEGLYTISFEASDGMANDSEVAIINVVEEASLNLSNVYDSYLYDVSPQDLCSNNLSLELEK
ncbi:right-handed parallel beta-helix repeat-containing protein [Methanosarcina sp. UBA289]|uniref:right-handed parallel beta-helix repeat-containing protein n=1 Tax=Methanosarcina sp. UBA289 TaxID=1915574 RepID=UPI0025F8B72A|nr:right-handed parallel beta-helix repeat-containing protein [Methanosarcina sp. UBA289]